jgi:hypothetical protein
LNTGDSERNIMEVITVITDLMVTCFSFNQDHILFFQGFTLISTNNMVVYSV